MCCEGFTSGIILLKQFFFYFRSTSDKKKQQQSEDAKNIVILCCRCKTRNEPVREKTNNLGSDQVRHKPGCTVTEDCQRLEI